MKPVAKSFRAIHIGQRVYVRAPNLEGTYPVIGKTKRKILVETTDGRVAKVGPEVVLIARSEKSRQLLQQMVGGMQFQNPAEKPKTCGVCFRDIRGEVYPLEWRMRSRTKQVRDQTSGPYPACKSCHDVIMSMPIGLKRNPSDSQVDAGVREYENFHWGEPPNFVAEIEPPVPKGTIHGIGELVGVIYKTKKGKRGRKSDQYIHHFKKERPVLAYDEEGKLVVVGGDYTIEDRGIVD